VSNVEGEISLKRVRSALRWRHSGPALERKRSHLSAGSSGSWEVWHRTPDTGHLRRIPDRTRIRPLL